MTDLLLLAVPFVLGLTIWLLLMWNRKRVRAGKPDLFVRAGAVKPVWPRSAWAAGTFMVTCWVADVLLRRFESQDVVRFGATVLPLAPLVWLVVEWASESRSKVDRVRRLRLEALSFAGPAFLMMVTWVQVTFALSGTPLNSNYASLAFFGMFYVFGLFFAQFRNVAAPSQEKLEPSA
jgi:hypothetical protein